MWSLRQQLATLSNYPADGLNHLPDGFDASNGIRVLFPPNQAISISALKNYVFSFNGSAQTPGGVSGNYFVGADGAGRWSFYFIVTVGQNSGLFGAGFVFTFTDDGFGHGWVLIVNANGLPWSALAAGTDPWIRGHWPQIFVQTVDLYLSDAEGWAGLPPLTNAATNYGFEGLTILQGSNAPPGAGPPPGIDERPGTGEDDDPKN